MSLKILSEIFYQQYSKSKTMKLIILCKYCFTASIKLTAKLINKWIILTDFVTYISNNTKYASHAYMCSTTIFFRISTNYSSYSFWSIWCLKLSFISSPYNIRTILRAVSSLETFQNLFLLNIPHCELNCRFGEKNPTRNDTPVHLFSVEFRYLFLNF